MIRNKFWIKLPRKKQYNFLLKSRQRQCHACTRYFLLLRGFEIKLFALVKIGGICSLIKIESEIRIFDLINSVKKKKKYASVTC